MFAQQLTAELQELAELERLAPDLVAAELRAFIASLQARRKTCFRCATETIGERRPKRGQRTFHDRECSAAQAREDHTLRGSRK